MKLRNLMLIMVAFGVCFIEAKGQSTTTSCPETKYLRCPSPISDQLQGIMKSVHDTWTKVKDSAGNSTYKNAKGKTMDLKGPSAVGSLTLEQYDANGSPTGTSLTLPWCVGCDFKDCYSISNICNEPVTIEGKCPLNAGQLPAKKAPTNAGAFTEVAGTHCVYKNIILKLHPGSGFTLLPPKGD